MARESDTRELWKSGVARPSFVSYLLPTSFKLPSHRRASTTTSSSEASPATSAETTPENSPPKRDAARSRLACVAPDTIVCARCSADLAFASQIISKGFTGRYGRAFLVDPKRTSTADHSNETGLLNIRFGKSESRQLVTGWHKVADVFCLTCNRTLGWKYMDAKEESQKYKIDKFILETERTRTKRSWEDADESGVYDAGDGGDEDEVELDIDDEDECDDLFAGTWDAQLVAQRRQRMQIPPRPEEVADS